MIHEATSTELWATPPLRQWVVYLLLCSDGSLYCGITNDLDKRVLVHNQGKGAKYTRSRLPVELVYSENVKNKSAALKREAKIKAMPRDKKVCLVPSWFRINLCRIKGSN